jgi:PEP-CTERM motif
LKVIIKTSLASALWLLSLSPAAAAEILDYTASGDATGTFSLSLDAGVYTLNSVALTIAGQTFDRSTTGLLTDQRNPSLGGLVSGPAILSGFTSDFFFSFNPAAAQQTTAVTYITPSSALATRGFASITRVAAVPEPSTWAMMLIGFGAVGYSMRRRRTQVRITYA